MAPVRQAPWAVCVAVLQGARAAALMTAQVNHDVYQRDGSLTSTQTQVVWLGDGYTSCSPHIRVYDGTGDNPGTDNATSVDACGSACAGKHTPIDGVWGDWDADAISVVTKQGDSEIGRCYCVRLDTCGSISTAGSAIRYQTFAIVSPTPAHATGDPHMQNIHGERFDLMKPGKHVLIHIPRGVTADKALLRVQAVARRLGARCSDLYFQDINVTGKWTNSDLHYSAQVVADDTPQWTKFGPVELKVAHGHTEKGVKYLNFYVKHLGRAGAAVGGLLGEDDSAEAATPSAECRKVVSVEKMATRTAWELPGASVAIAAM